MTQIALPKTLYKFGHLERADIIKNGSIRYTRIYDLNDPFEVPKFEETAISEDGGKTLFWDLDRQMESFNTVMEDALPDSIAGDEAFRSRLNARIQNTLNDANRQGRGLVNDKLSPFWNAFRTGQFDCGVLSVSEAVSSPLMWAHYANNHAGIAIGFDPSHPCFQTSTEPGEMRLGEFRPVIYGDTRPSHELMTLDPASTLFHKAEDWSYEREWRSIKDLDEAVRVLAIDEPVHLFELHPAAITELVFGYRVTDEEIANVIGSIEPVSTISLFRAVPASGTYSLEKAPLDI